MPSHAEREVKNPTLRWFLRETLKLDEDEKFSEKVQNKGTYRMAK